MIKKLLKVVVWVLLLPVLFFCCYVLAVGFATGSQGTNTIFLYAVVGIVSAFLMVFLSLNSIHRFLSYVVIAIASAVILLVLFKNIFGQGFHV